MKQTLPGCRQEELTFLVKGVEICFAGANVSLDVEVVAHVDVAHQGRPVVHVSLLVHPGNGRFRYCLKEF